MGRSLPRADASTLHPGHPVMNRDKTAPALLKEVFHASAGALHINVLPGWLAPSLCLSPSKLKPFSLKDFQDPNGPRYRNIQTLIALIKA